MKLNNQELRKIRKKYDLSLEASKLLRIINDCDLNWYSCDGSGEYDRFLQELVNLDLVETTKIGFNKGVRLKNS